MLYCQIDYLEASSIRLCISLALFYSMGISRRDSIIWLNSQFCFLVAFLGMGPYTMPGCMHDLEKT